MTTFDIQPYVGALPVRFGMSRPDVRALFSQPPRTLGQQQDDYFGRVRVAYESEAVVELGFAPGDFHLQFSGREIWTPSSQSDPLPLLLRHDSQPLESHGFLIFRELGVTVTGYHDDDVSQRAITCFVRGRWDQVFPRCKQPNLSRYDAGGSRAA
jgi:hypothetical protein